MFTPGASTASWLLQIGLASVRSEPGVQEAVVVYEPLVWRAFLVVVLEQHRVAFYSLLCTTMQLAHTASPSALGFLYELVQPSRWVGVFHRRLVDEIPLFNTWRPRGLPKGKSLGEVYDGRMAVVGVGSVFTRTGHATPFRGSIMPWLQASGCGGPAICLPPLTEGPHACMVVKLSSMDGNMVLLVLMFIQLKAMQSPLSGKELQHAKDTVILGRMGNVKGTVKDQGAVQRGTVRAAALAAGVKAWAKANNGVVLGWLVCPLSNLPRSTPVIENVDSQTLFNVDARALGAGSDRDDWQLLAKGAMLAELTAWTSHKQ